MTLTAAIGVAQSPQAGEAGAQAVRTALRGMGKTPPVIAWVFVAEPLPFEQVVEGAASVLGNLPIIGASVCAAISPVGPANRAVVIALFGGEGVTARADWRPSFAENGKRCAQELLHAMQPEIQPDSLLYLIPDGVNGDAAAFLAELPSGAFTAAGLLGGGDLTLGRTYQVGGNASGAGGLAAALLSGPLKLGYAAAHGWQQVGAVTRLTRTRGVWLRALDGKRASETYTRLFGPSTDEWSQPPLNSLARLYPLGIQAQDGSEGAARALIVRSPLRIETDGSLRLNTAVPEGATAHVLVASVESCLQAARAAARRALERLGDARPRLAILGVDCAWRMLFQERAGEEIAAVRAILGPELPLLGGYGFGQILPAEDDPQRAALLNQHLSILLLGE